MSTVVTKHSPKGASGAERWMNCPGSNVMLATLDLPESDDADWRIEGVAAHAGAAYCLVQDIDAYEIVGKTFEEFVIDADTAEAIQFYLDEVNRVHSSHPEGSTTMVEVHISADFHPDFYGTADWVCVSVKRLSVRDYKHGIGIAVDAEDNDQLRYYALGILLKFPDVEEIDVGIIQPRAFHKDGPIRTVSYTRAELLAWKDDKLIPAMLRAEFDTTLVPGEWCRFCPAKLACPLLTGLFGVAATADQQVIPNMSDMTISLNYKMIASVKHYTRALEADVYRRLNAGMAIEGFKLVHKQANRVYKDGAERVFKDKFGNDIYTKPAMKSPAEIGKINSVAKKLVSEWAYTPTTGLTVAPEADRRAPVKVQSAAETFAHLVPKQPE